MATGGLEIPAVNFPLVIDAPPAAQTISIAQLRQLGKRGSRRSERKRR
jgi:hypothetical protein